MPDYKAIKVTSNSASKISLNSAKLEKCRTPAKAIQKASVEIRAYLKAYSAHLSTNSASLNRALSARKEFSILESVKRIEVQAMQMEMLNTIIGGAADQAKGKTGALAAAIGNASKMVTNINATVNSINKSAIGSATGIKSMSAAWSSVKKAWVQVTRQVSAAKTSYKWSDRVNGTVGIWRITQDKESKDFDKKFWEGISSPGTQCDYAAAAMALSCLGYKISAKDLGSGYAHWKDGAAAASKQTCVDGKKYKIGYMNTKKGGEETWLKPSEGKIALDNALKNYENDPENYAAPIIYMPRASKYNDGHWVMITGKDAKGNYTVVDPSAGTNMKGESVGNNGTKLQLVSKVKDTYKGCESGTYKATVGQVVQFYKK